MTLENIELLLEGFRERVPYQIMRTLLRKNELLVGQGRNKTIDKLLNQYRSADEDKKEELEKLFSSLKRDYYEHVLTGEKQVKLFRINVALEDSILKSVKDLKIEETPFLKSYPLPLPKEDLKDLDSSTYLTERIIDDEVITLVFCTSRFSVSREHIKTAELGFDDLGDLAGYDEIIAIKKHCRQFFDVVNIWRGRGLVEIRMDISGKLPANERLGAFVNTRRALARSFPGNKSIESVFSQEVDIFPLLKRMYERKSEGRVVEMSFSTGDGSIKHESNRSNNQDLRDEAYHKAGRQAVNNIDLYRLAIQWNFQTTPSLLLDNEFLDERISRELFIPGNSTILNNPQESSISEFQVHNCLGKKDYNLVFEKVIKYLKSDG